MTTARLASAVSTLAWLCVAAPAAAQNPRFVPPQVPRAPSPAAPPAQPAPPPASTTAPPVATTPRAPAAPLATPSPLVPPSQLVAPPPPPVDGPTFTLADVIAAISRAHPLLASGRAGVRAAQYDVVGAGLWTNPQINLFYSRSFTPWTSYDPIVGYPQVMVTQLIETAGVPAARRRAAELTLAAARAEFDGVRRGLVFDAQTAFVTLAAAVQRAAILRETAARLERADAIVRARVAAGTAPRYDASRMGVALADARAAVADAEADVTNARGALAIAVGPAASSLRGDPVFDLTTVPEPPPLPQLRDEMAASRPDIVATRERLRAAGVQVDVARRSVFQGVVVSAGVAYGAGLAPLPGQPANSTQYSQVDFVGSVTIPLPVVDRGQGTIPAAQARSEALVRTLDAVLLAAEQRLRANHAEVRRRREALAAYLATGVTTSVGLLQEAEAGYREGRLSVLELVDAYISVRDAQLRANSLALDAQLAAVNLWRAVGTAPRR